MGRDAFFAEQDALGYWALGAALAKPDTFWPTLSSLTDRMPLYLLLLAGVQHAFGDAPRAVALIQAVIDAGTCALIAALGALISPLTGLIAGVLAALSVTLVVFSTQMLTDSLFVFFFTLMLLAGAHFLLRPTMALAVWAGLAGGLALATRPSVAVLLTAAVPVVFVVALVRRWSVGPALAAALLFAIAAAAPIAPVLVRNAIRYDSLSVTSQTGDYLALWVVPPVTGPRRRHPLQTALRSQGPPLPPASPCRVQSLPPLGHRLRPGVAGDGAFAAGGSRQGLARGHGGEPRCTGAARGPAGARAAEAKLLQHARG